MQKEFVMETCPPIERLRELLADQLSGLAAEALEAHVEAFDIHRATQMR